MSEYPYLLMLINIWLEDWEDHLEKMNVRGDDDNRKSVGMTEVFCTVK